MKHPRGTNGDTTPHTMLPDVDHDELERKAHEVEYKTNLSPQDAMIVVGVREDLDDGEIGLLIGRSSLTVQRKRQRLRERKWELQGADAEIELLEDV